MDSGENFFRSSIRGGGSPGRLERENRELREQADWQGGQLAEVLGQVGALKEKESKLTSELDAKLLECRRLETEL